MGYVKRLLGRWSRLQMPTAAIYWALAATIVVAPAAPAVADDRPALPGYVWVISQYPSDLLGDEQHNSIVLAGFQQGIDLLKITQNIRVNAFGEVFISRDKEQFDYNNKLIVGGGAQISYQPKSWMQFHVGVKYDQEQRYVSHQSDTGPTGFATWQIIWPAAPGFVPKGSAAATRFTIASQGQILYPSSLEPGEANNPLIQANAQVGYDVWRTSDRKYSFNIFSQLDFADDHRRIDRYNYIQPSVGAQIRLSVVKDTYINIGADYASQTRFVSRTSRSGPTAFVNWVAWWW